MITVCIFSQMPYGLFGLAQWAQIYSLVFNRACPSFYCLHRVKYIFPCLIQRHHLLKVNQFFKFLHFSQCFAVLPQLLTIYAHPSIVINIKKVRNMQIFKCLHLYNCNAHCKKSFSDVINHLKLAQNHNSCEISKRCASLNPTKCL